jgi:hypothetical protein
MLAISFSSVICELARDLCNWEQFLHAQVTEAWNDELTIWAIPRQPCLVLILTSVQSLASVTGRLLKFEGIMVRLPDSLRSQGDTTLEREASFYTK